VWDDLVGGLGPDKWFAALVPGVDEDLDGGDRSLTASVRDGTSGRRLGRVGRSPHAEIAAVVVPIAVNALVTIETTCVALCSRCLYRPEYRGDGDLDVTEHHDPQTSWR
jgi:hypothetical protein